MKYLVLVLAICVVQICSATDFVIGGDIIRQLGGFDSWTIEVFPAGTSTVVEKESRDDSSPSSYQIEGKVHSDYVDVLCTVYINGNLVDSEIAIILSALFTAIS